jgi:hypothetical protein
LSVAACRNKLRQLTITITIEVLTEKKAVCSNVVPGQARVLSMLPINSPLRMRRQDGKENRRLGSEECS